ncbi:5-oxoprolinase [Paraphaeosphaeria sporulosa]
MGQHAVDIESQPQTFQAKWTANPDPTALPFPRDNPPFALTAVDWHQLSITDDQFTPHTWENVHHLISTGQLDELKRWPSFLKAYLAWTAHIKAKYGSATQYILQQRLFWEPLNTTGSFKFELVNETPFADSADYKIIKNDWTYAVTEGISHIVVWSKKPLPVDEVGALTHEGRRLVEEFVKREFRDKAGEEVEGTKVQWFKNTTILQSSTEVAVRASLKQTLQSRGDTLVTIEKDGSATFDFTGTSCELYGNMNAPPAIAHSVLLYSLRLLIGLEISMNQGYLTPTKVVLPEGYFLNPSANPTIYARNTNTSQRVVDVIIKAFEVSGASQGCMNCLVFFGEGGKDPNSNKLAGHVYAFGETIYGGSGATAVADGARGVHTYMTNARITDPNLSKRDILSFCVSLAPERAAAGTFIVITERRVTEPYGMKGGETGGRAANYWVKKRPDGNDRWIILGPKNMVAMDTGGLCVIYTPGSGGFGPVGAVNGGRLNGMQKTPYSRAAGSVTAYADTQAQAN